MRLKKLISSYDEKNDRFVGKIEGTNGYLLNYAISDNIFLNLDKNKYPSSILIENASKILNVSKSKLKHSNIKIIIDCNALFVNFNLFIDDLKSYSFKTRNCHNISNSNIVVDNSV